jgi:hypothetical protein
MKTLLRITLMLALSIAGFMAGFAVGFPTGQSRGFSTGSEWAFVQANLLAREAGLFMPVNYEAGQFRIMLKQPKHLYRTAWTLADRYEDEMAYLNSGNGTLNDRIQQTRMASMLP